MQDPERLLSATSDADALEREVLTNLRHAKAPAHARSAAWHGVAAGIAAAALPASAAGTGAASASVASAGSGTASAGAATGAAPAAAAKVAVGVGSKTVLSAVATKVVLTAALSAVALAGAYTIHEQRASTGNPTPPTHHARQAPIHDANAPAHDTPATTVQVTTPIDAPAPTAPTRTPPATALAPRVANKAKPSDLLAEESRLLGEARAQLRGGDAAAADATLERLQRGFANGALLQEREVLRIDVLEARGDHVAAKRAARTFVKRYPTSPHSTKLRLLLTAP
jgi:hypothetical protein